MTIVVGSLPTVAFFFDNGIKNTSRRARQILALRLFTNNPLLTHPTQLLGQFLIANFKLLLQAIDNCITLDGGENFLNYRILSQGTPGAAFF